MQIKKHLLLWAVGSSLPVAFCQLLYLSVVSQRWVLGRTGLEIAYRCVNILNCREVSNETTSIKLVYEFAKILGIHLTLNNCYKYPSSTHSPVLLQRHKSRSSKRLIKRRKTSSHFCPYHQNPQIQRRRRKTQP